MVGKENMSGKREWCDLERTAAKGRERESEDWMDVGGISKH